MAKQKTQAFTQLKEHLRTMFQLDRGDLDFGIYRITNQQREEISQFLDNQLLPQVRSVLHEYQSADLYNFFKRYYAEGDFISLRRYKEGVYALPYEGEEVKTTLFRPKSPKVSVSTNLRQKSIALAYRQNI